MSRFLDRLEAQIAKMYGADPQSSQDYCRIVNERHFARLMRLIEDAKAKGGTVHTGRDGAAKERYIAPTILIDAAEDSLVMHEEIFGPILPVRSFTDIARPIAEINARPKPLALYVFAKNARVAEKVVTETSSGGVGINATVLQFAHNNLPFGGEQFRYWQQSRNFGFKAFSHERGILKNYASVTRMMFPPYNRRARFLIKTTLRFFA